MRILCCVNRDLASNHALNLLLPQLHGHSTRIILSDRVGRPGAFPAHLRALNLLEQGVPNEIVFPLAERCIARDGRWLTFAELAEQYAQAPATILDLNAGEGARVLGEFAPDLIVTIRYGRILKDAALHAPRLGVINLHSGVLPDYRGILSTLYAMISGETDIGCTLHWIVDSGIDTGPIIAVARRPVELGHSLLWHILSLYPIGIPLIVEAVRRLTSGEELPRTEQDRNAGSYRSFPAPADVAALNGRGVELVDAADLRAIAATYGVTAQH
ncbi:MAG: formyl transferase [Gemmatimonadota bacterium]